MRKSYLLILLYLVFCLTACAGSTLAADAKDGVVCIAVYDAQSNLLSWGTGFAIGRDSDEVTLIATNYHVVADSLADGNSLQVFYAAEGDNSISARILMQDETKDLAIVELSTTIKVLRPLRLVQSDQVAIAEDIYALGFPGDTFDTATIDGFNRTDITIVNGIISNKVIQNEQKVYQISASISPGFSGGPLVNADGDVIGINTRISNGDNIIGYSIASDELMAILDQSDIGYLSQVNFFEKYVIVIIAVALILLGLLIMVFLRIVKNNQKLLKVKPVVNTLFQKSTQPDGDSTTLYISGLTGELAASRFGIRKGKLLFGTNSSTCDVVFKDADMISEEHCKIERDPETGLFTLTDLNSKNGSSINDIRIEPMMKMPINNGDILFVAGKSNMFKIRIEQSL